MNLCFAQSVQHMDMATQAKQRLILCVAHHKGTRPHGTREHPMDTGPNPNLVERTYMYGTLCHTAPNYIHELMA